MFEWRKQYLTHSLRSVPLTREIKVISSRQRVIFSIYSWFVFDVIIIIIIIIIINGIFTQDNPSVQSTVINGVLLTKN